jgi:hypothetical protein
MYTSNFLTQILLLTLILILFLCVTCQQVFARQFSLFQIRTSKNGKQFKITICLLSIGTNRTLIKNLVFEANQI